MKILFGTTNQGKLDNMRLILEKINVEVLGLSDLDKEIPFVDENGETPLDNARLKSKAYFDAYGLPVFSYDSGLYFIEEDLTQPATFVRRYVGYEMDDDQMIEHYSKLATDNGGNIKAQYINGICFIVDEKNSYEYQGPDISGEPFYITEVPHKRRTEGFPLNTLSKSIETNQYYFDMDPADRKGKSKWEEGILKFFKGRLNIE